ncbi:MAG: hypothetical protein HDS74_00455 [Bacteroidales bacterium]|nr:hypothetical protein [Bacteroidales bacterium]MBD5211565.1 hypothetical protein [Bacteroidales bacterium]MBD5218259.1 hypothetical protein [Bacteroidales bacterium]
MTLPHHSPTRRAIRLCSPSVLTLLMILASCSGKTTKPEADTDTDTIPVIEDIFHANNDIAMTVRSIMDAISQGEPLDTAVYNFEGVLTDGSGAALYINEAGSPGLWKVKVDSTNAQIENIELGKFSPDNVRQYICGEVKLTEDSILRKGVVKGEGALEMTNYTFPGGEVHFESAKARTADGKEGPVLSILILKNLTEQKASVKK